MSGTRNTIAIGAAAGGALGLALGVWLGDLFGGVLGGAFLGGLIGLVVRNGGRSASTARHGAVHDGFPHHPIGPHHLGLGAVGLAAAHHAQDTDVRAPDATCAPDTGADNFSSGADCGPADSGGGGGGDY